MTAAATQSMQSGLVENGLLLHAKGDFTSADACYAEALAADPRDADALLLRGIVARETGDAGASVRWCEQAAQLRPESTRVLMNLCRSLCVEGRTHEAETRLLEALRRTPDDAQLWCGLAEVAFSADDENTARSCLRRAQTIKPGCWKTYQNEIRLLLQQRRYPEAVQSAERAIRAFPAVGELYLDAAMAASLSGDHDRAIALCRTAVGLDPDSPEAYLALGHAYTVKDSLEDALPQYERALRLRPRDTAIARAVGETLFGLDRNQEAMRILRQCVAAELRVAASWYLLGRVLAHEKKYEEAESCFRRAIALGPEEAKHRNALGTAILFRRTREAVDLLRQAVELSPTWSVPHVNLGIGMMLLGDAAAMRTHYLRAIELEPACAGAQYNLSLADLREGHYPEGWVRYEYRWKFDELKLKQRHTHLPQWQGEPLAGKTILLHAEQGLGDGLQFLRYVPLVAALGGSVVLEIPSTLSRIARSLPGVATFVDRDNDAPPCDLQCPLMGLPRIFGTTVETIPGQHPYLSVDERDATAARERFPNPDPRAVLRVGVVWAGNPSLRTNEFRSMPLETMLPLLGVEHVAFFSLQKGAGHEDMERLPAGAPLVDAGPHLRDFHDTAALMKTLDLVITVDTSCAHMAGALGVPVWVLVAQHPDWRWIERDGRSAWYPSARVIGQQGKGWEEVIPRVRTRLTLKAEEAAASCSEARRESWAQGQCAPVYPLFTLPPPSAGDTSSTARHHTSRPIRR